MVDDDSNITSLLQVNLLSEGYSVDVVDNAESVDRTAQDSTSLVIVDAMNQPYSGMDLIYDFKDDPATEHIAIILYSPIKSERMVIDALDAGADDYIVKPFSLRELLCQGKNRYCAATAAIPARPPSYHFSTSPSNRLRRL